MESKPHLNALSHLSFGMINLIQAYPMKANYLQEFVNRKVECMPRVFKSTNLKPKNYSSFNFDPKNLGSKCCHVVVEEFVIKYGE